MASSGLQPNAPSTKTEEAAPHAVGAEITKPKAQSANAANTENVAPQVAVSAKIAQPKAPLAQAAKTENAAQQVAAGAESLQPKASSAEAESDTAVTVRPKVQATVKQLAAAAKEIAKPNAKAKAVGTPATGAATASKEKVKDDKIQPEVPSENSTFIPVIPAQVPAPSVAGVSATPRTDNGALMQVAAPGANSTYRPSPAAGTTAPAVEAARVSEAQLSGTSFGYPAAAPTAAISKAAAAVASTQPVSAPKQAVEIVSRTPVAATTSMPPAAAAPPANVPSVGYANALTQMSQTSIKAASPAPQPEAALPNTTGAAATPTIPKVGPPAVAVGRSVARGSNPVRINEGGQPCTPIAKRYQIVFVSAEVAPWSKTGGLGEAMDGLPIALAALGHRVMTISPRYDQYAEGWETEFESAVPMGPNTESVRCFHAFQSKVDRVFVDHNCFLAKVCGKSGSMLYGPEWGKDFADNQWRFMYFAKAVLKIIKELPLGGYAYGSDCIVVVNDWHCSLLPVYLEMEKRAGEWANTKTAIIIHNAVFQGRFDRDDPEEPAKDVYGLPEEVMKTFTFNMSLKVGRTEKPVPHCINWMAAATTYVDKILTVSPTYAWELINLPEMGVNLDEIFMAKGVTGIVNGVKETVDPANPSFAMQSKMLSPFSVKDVDMKKAELKAHLQELYGLPTSLETPLCVFVGRMDLQKGYDYLLAALASVLETVDLQVILIGTGRADLVASTKTLAKTYPGKVHVAGWCGPERYAIVAGADFNLMPSRWEPCGLAQMESMRFGTLPVVAQTGGLIDTVQDMVTGVHLGGAVSVEKELDPKSVELVARALETCVNVYSDSDRVSNMRKAAMAASSEYTWSNAALQYEVVFEQLGVVDVLPRCGDAEVTLQIDKAVA